MLAIVVGHSTYGQGSRLDPRRWCCKLENMGRTRRNLKPKMTRDESTDSNHVRHIHSLGLFAVGELASDFRSFKLKTRSTNLKKGRRGS